MRADAEGAERARGTARIVFVHGAGRIYGLAEPELQWDGDVRCRLQPHPDVLHAIILLPEGVDVLYSGVPDYAAAGEESPYLLTDCRLHGYRAGRRLRVHRTVTGSV